MVLGDVGVHVGMRLGKYSISYNRATNSQDLIGNLLYFGFPQTSWMIRETLQFCDLFACAESKMKYATISMESNIMITGQEKGQGVLIKRGRDEIKEI
jgi:hypothetical protein